MVGRTDSMVPVSLEIVIVAGEAMRLSCSSRITAWDETSTVIRVSES